jgi:hypothetical protein
MARRVMRQRTKGPNSADMKQGFAIVENLLHCCRLVGRALRAATRQPRRRAWLRIFGVRCSLPCDPLVGGHSCNGRMIPRFHRAVCDYR